MTTHVSVVQDTRKFHTHTGLVCLAVLLFCTIGSPLASIQTPGTISLLAAAFFCIAALLPLPAYWHQKQRPEMREAALTLLWAVAVVFILPPAVFILGRSGMPLQDAVFIRIDHALGVSVPAIELWATHHTLGRAISATYPLLFLFAPLAILLPALSGRWQVAREFVAANIAAYIIGLTAFGLLPAVGPWYGYHFTPDAGQVLCQTELFTLRAPGHFIPHTPGLVCFPSFHVIWSLLSARALWTFRSIRIPASILAAMIVLSTLTTGWHYFADVLGGFAVAAISLWLASRLHAAQPAQPKIPPS